MDSAFFRKIAVRVSMSGRFSSVTKPHSNRDTKRGANPSISLGVRSEVSTICL